MPSPNVLEFTVQSFTPTQLAVKVKNISGAVLDKPLTIELYPLLSLVDQRIKDAAKAAATNPDLAGVATLKGVVTGALGWSVWAKGEMSDSIVVIMLINDRDKDGVEIPPVKLDAGDEFIILIPLNSQPHHGRIDLLYSYKYDTNPRQDGTLELRSPDTDDWKPDVTLKTDQASPTMIDPKTDVKIFWHVRDGVSAVLRGPLPGGNSEWTLSDETSSDYKMSDGSFLIKAVGPMTYILQAEVKRPDGKPNVQVVKMLSLDVFSKGKYGYLNARPRRVLPYGLVEIDWAAWGVKEVFIDAGGAARKITLTDMTLSGSRQGEGVMRVTAGKPAGEQPLETNVDLNVEINKKMETQAETKFKVIPWRKMQKSEFTGQPVGMAVAAPQMALLTTDGLWIANVNIDDFTPINYDQVQKVSFTNTTKTEKPKAWLALAASGGKFVILRQTNSDDLQVALYTNDGKPDEIPTLDLPPDLRLFMGRGAAFDLAVFANRAFVVAEAMFRTGPVRRAFSVGFNSSTKKAEYRAEPLLELLSGYRLLNFDDGLWALSRASGQMLRFKLTPDGKLEAHKAASAVDQRGASMLKEGVLVSVGRVLAVLSPTSVPSLAALDAFGLKNVLRYQNLTPLKDPGTIRQDLVYSPQNDRWSRCGHGLDATAGVVAFRGGDSERLWFIEPNADTYTLTVSSEHLFLPDYVTDVPSKPLPPVLDRKREFKIFNSTPMQFVEMNDACRRAGVTPFSTTGPVEMNPPTLTNLRTGIEEKFELTYNQADPPTVTLRFLMQRPAGIKNEYFLELTLSGPDLANATSVFKRIAPDTLAIAEVPGTKQQHSTTGRIEFSPKPLLNGIQLRLRNNTPYQLWQRSPDGEKEWVGDAIKINYNTPSLSIYAHGAGELSFDVDFALPQGIEVTLGNVSQTQRMRVNWDKSLGLLVESTAVQETSDYDAYECSLRYNYWKPLPGVFIGDGVPTKDGASIYVPLAYAAMAGESRVVKYRASDFANEGSVALNGGGIFSAPNSVVVLSDRVLACVNGNILSQFTPAMKFEGGTPLYWHDMITNLKGSPNDNKFFTLGINEHAGGPFRHSYSYAGRSFSHIGEQQDMVLDAQKGFRPSPPISGAPAWVSPNVISPMDVSLGLAVAICVQGGIFLIDVKGKRVMEVAIQGTGREEAILIDPTEPLVYCAHAQPDKRALMVTRLNSSNPNERQTITLPGVVEDMATNTNPPAGVDLRYNLPRAVSLIATADSLYVSHGRKIYVLEKRRFVERQKITVDLPCRLIQVRRGRLPGEAHPKYRTPSECTIVWAIGATYVGDGQSRQKYQTSLYRIGVVL